MSERVVMFDREEPAAKLAQSMVDLMNKSALNPKEQLDASLLVSLSVLEAIVGRVGSCSIIDDARNVMRLILTHDKESKGQLLSSEPVHKM